jgi:DNA-binding IclR family transcriptional regulator
MHTTVVSPAQGTQMIDRTVALMRLVATYRPKGARLTDLAEEAFLPAPTVRRILKRLVDHGLIQQDPSEHRYRLGPLAYEFGLSVNYRTSEVAPYQPLLEELGQVTGNYMYLLMRSGLDSLCVDRTDPPETTCRVTLQIGDRLPIGVGVGGMALLAALPCAEAESVMAANQSVYRRFVRATGTSFHDHLEAARRTGYAIRRSPVTPGVVGFGIVLPSADNKVRMAVSCAVDAKRFSETARTETVALMREIIARHIPAAPE